MENALGQYLLLKLFGMSERYWAHAGTKAKVFLSVCLSGGNAVCSQRRVKHLAGYLQKVKVVEGGIQATAASSTTLYFPFLFLFKKKKKIRQAPFFSF